MADTDETHVWWTLATNPPCRPWCELEHMRDEFSGLGGITCSRSFGDGVFVSQGQEAGVTVFAVDVSPPFVELADFFGPLHPWLAEDLSDYLHMAAEFCRTLRAGGEQR